MAQVSLHACVGPWHSWIVACLLAGVEGLTSCAHLRFNHKKSFRLAVHRV